jgi:hypothetical protein
MDTDNKQTEDLKVENLADNNLDETKSKMDIKKEIPEIEYTASAPEDTPRVKLIKRILLIIGFIGLMALTTVVTNYYMEWRFPDSLKELNKRASTTEVSETEADLNVKIDNDTNGREEGKSLDELVGGSSALKYGNDYYESMANKASDSASANGESINNPSNEETSAGESEGVASPENEVSEDEIKKMVESKVENDNKPVESQGIGVLEDNYNKQIESANSNESLQAELNELMKKVQ